jgi:hypothetical protein
MDPIANAITTLLNAVQALDQPGQAAAPPLPILLALAGQDVNMQFLGPAPGGGLLLALPSGQTVTAQGQMPYPEGTQLLVRVLAGPAADAPVRLQTLQAAPPAAPAILAPLNQGEAGSLLAALGVPDPPPALAPLAGLFQFLGPGQGLPDPGQVRAALDTLPAPALAGLKSLLGVPGADPAALAAALDSWLVQAAASPREGQSLAQGLLQRFQTALEHRPDLPGPAETLVPWLRNLLGGADARAVPAQGHGVAESPAQVLNALLGGREGAPAAAPETWEAWIRTGVKALSDPAVSPQGAAFHQAQAREGTAFYELPLPWAPQSPLQIWVESDRNPRNPGGKPGPETQRVLLGLSFTNLGETRLGIVRSGADLQVRVWTEHPELLAASRDKVEGELKDLGSSVDLKIMALHPGPGGSIPSLRSELTGATLHALG